MNEIFMPYVQIFIFIIIHVTNELFHGREKGLLELGLDFNQLVLNFALQ